MPFNIDFKNKYNQLGRLTIDRNNLIFQFIPASDDMIERKKAFRLREDFYSAIEIGAAFTAKTFPAQMEAYAMEDTRHRIADHLCSSDSEVIHVHYKFVNNVDYKLVESLLTCLPSSVLDDYITAKDTKHILTAVKGYFDELQNDQTAIQIEQEYVENKTAAFLRENTSQHLTREKHELIEKKNQQPAAKWDLLLQYLLVESTLNDLPTVSDNNSFQYGSKHWFFGEDDLHQNNTKKEYPLNNGYRRK